MNPSYRMPGLVFKVFQKASRVGDILISGGKIFQSAGATTEKTRFLDIPWMTRA